MKKFRWAMIICLLMIFIISGCESSKKRNPQDNNPPIEEEEVRAPTDQSATIDAASLAAFKGFNDHVNDIQTEASNCILIETTYQVDSINKIDTLNGVVRYDTHTIYNDVGNPLDKNDYYNDDTFNVEKFRKEKLDEFYYTDASGTKIFLSKIYNIDSSACAWENSEKVTLGQSNSISLPFDNGSFSYNTILKQFHTTNTYKYVDNDNSLILTNESKIILSNETANTYYNYSIYEESLDKMYVFIASNDLFDEQGNPNNSIELKYNAYLFLDFKVQTNPYTFYVIDAVGNKQEYTTVVDNNDNQRYELWNNGTHIGYMKLFEEKFNNNKIIKFQFYDTEDTLFN